jgi:hypothetical protein
VSTVYAVTSARLASDVAYLTVETLAGLAVGYKIHVANVGQHYDGEQTLTGVNSTTCEISYAKNHADIAAADVTGQAVLQVTWIDTNDVVPYLGIWPSEDADLEWFESCVDAANTWCFEKRQAAGYFDLPNHVPTVRVKAGAVMKAAELYRRRGTTGDQFASFNQFDGTQPVYNDPEILRLLGINRPQVA